MLSSTYIAYKRSWNSFKYNVSAQLITNTADQMVALGLKDAGYEYVIIDDGWQNTTRGEDSRQQPNPTRFPDGIGRIANYVHSKNLKLGIYSDAGVMTCGFLPGSWGYEELDAQTYADWGIDYLKVSKFHAFKVYPQTLVTFLV